MFYRFIPFFCWLLATLLPLVSFAQEVNSFSMPAGITKADYAPHTLIIKIAPAQNARTQSGTDALTEIRSLTGVNRIEPAIPVRKRQASARARTQRPLVDIDNIYKIKLAEGQDLEVMINRLLQMEQVLYAEPYYLLKPLGINASEYVPNDPAAAKSGGAQTYLARIKAYQAWAVEKGDTSITIGILDTGIEFGHQDLSDNLKNNSNDPINGLDDDGDGYVDNYSGWDFADEDNDPTADQNIHGILVTGLAAASTDNNTGIAGTGFRSRYMPVKIFSSVDGSFFQGYEAVAYAADQGCQVINLSWGGANAFSYFGQDMIDYAVLEKDAVVVAAAGNSGKFENFYPASFNHVLSVGQTDNNDNRVNTSTYGYFVDLLAPGQSIYTTSGKDGYQSNGGSSLSAPMVSGTAALMRASYPELNALQIMEKLRLASDDIYAVGNNANFAEKLGRGRLNMLKALSDQATPALRMSAFSYRNHVGPYAFYGDTLSIEATFINYLSPSTSAAKVTLSSPSEYVTVLDSVFTIGALDTLASATNQQLPFRVYLHENTPANEQLYFRLAYEDGSYADYQYFFIVSSPPYSYLDNGQAKLAINSQGDIGKDVSRSGLIFRGDTLARRLGLMVAAGADSVSDNIISDFSTATYSDDFVAEQNTRFGRSAVFAQSLESVFNDSNADNPIGLKIEQKWLSNNAPEDQQYLISEYRIINQGNDSLFQLYPALFADWDLGDVHDNRAGWDADHSMGYVYDDNLYAGIAVLGAYSSAYYAIDKADLNGNIADLETVFSDSLRYAWLTANSPKLEAGALGAGNDVAHLLGVSVDTLAPGRHIQVGFAWLFGNSLGELQQLAERAAQKYQEHRLQPRISQTIFACTDSTATVMPEADATYRFYRDALATELLGEGRSFTTGALSGDTLIYVSMIRQKGDESTVSQVNIRMLLPVADFRIKSVDQATYTSDTLFLNTSGEATLTMEDISLDAVSWQWDFGNGFRSSRQHPSVKYDKEGNYTISLKVGSAAGCESMTIRQLTVIRRAPKPVVADQQVCAGEPVSLAASNSSQIKVFADAGLSQLIFSGATFTSSALADDTVFYVVNAASVYESVAAAVKVDVLKPETFIAYTPESSLQGKYLLKLWAVHPQQSAGITGLQWYIDGQLVGSGDTIVYDYSREHTIGQDFEVSLSFTQTSGSLVCSQSVVRTIALGSSPLPLFEDVRVCRGEAVSLKPSNGNFFFFYRDAALTELLHKGSSYQIEDLQGEMTIYITGLDSLLESKATEVNVVLNRFADFSLSADTLFLQENSEVMFEGIMLKPEMQEISWQWDLGDGQLRNRGVRFSQTYDSVGTYPITLVARTQDGCTNTITKTLVVKNVTAVEEALENKSLLVYPNPSSGIFTLSNERWDYKKIMLHLYNAQGKALCHEQMIYDNFPVKIDLHQLAGHPLPDGIYYLYLEVEQKNFFRQMILKSAQ